MAAAASAWIGTRIVLGSRETPSYVSKEFHDCLKMMTGLFRVGRTTTADHIIYHVPQHFIASKSREEFDYYSICLDDSNSIPECVQRTILSKQRYTQKLAASRPGFDKMTVYTERSSDEYFLLLPNARFDHTEIHKQEETHVLEIDGNYWYVNFLQAFVDPHDTASTIWFFSQPRYQVEITTSQDFRQRPDDLKDSLRMLIPRIFQ